jgi:hypothetical protein
MPTMLNAMVGPLEPSLSADRRPSNVSLTNVAAITRSLELPLDGPPGRCRDTVEIPTHLSSGSMYRLDRESANCG